jgi:hypothetical protein
LGLRVRLDAMRQVAGSGKRLQKGTFSLATNCY